MRTVLIRSCLQALLSIFNSSFHVSNINSSHQPINDVHSPAELASPNLLLLAQLIDLLISLQGSATFQFHHGIQTLLFLCQLCLDLLLLLELGITCGLTLCIQNQLRVPQTHEYLDIIEKSAALPLVDRSAEWYF